ncbi:opaque-specific ABC transporter CDR3 [Metarhizium rileyi]|uniref:Opaque-specific ABC transporter CDR3 n=1 Tax=Metarhizium rileyi (strain RCEF 4871) TaxID=1649241 RepID=A0A166WXA7_METRR|nr:opaque-specific ABC transporter CDR3 [Metarhizium rileyi RCEF 4871]
MNGGIRDGIGEGDSMANAVVCQPSESDSTHCQTRRDNTEGGVSFRDLNCYGFMSAEQYQPTFTTWILQIINALLSWTLTRSRRPQRVEILRNFNGLVRPGELLLVLGRPGSGCSTFLKTLSGDTYGFRVDHHGIHYNGTDYSTTHRKKSGTCIYVAELDVHFPELTLGQTIAFAASTRPTGIGRKYPSMKASLSGYGRDICSTFRLQKAFDTKIGDSMIRGVSGGEKRRTSLAEAFVGGAQFQCWDNSTRGLDSSAALDFIRLLRNTADKIRSVVIMTIYQASEAQYTLFDKVVLLYEGRQVYFGPAQEAADYFQKLGFVKPNHSTTADFLTSLTNPVERLVREGYENRVPRTADDFELAWRQSDHAKAVLQEILDIESSLRPRKSEADSRPSATTRIIMPAYRQVVICIQRGFLRLANNYVPVVAGILANSILGLILGSAFYNLPDTAESMDKRAVLLFFSLIINACTPAFEVLTMWAQRPIVEKHNQYAYYYPFTEWVTSMLCDLPNKLATSILFNLALYFMTNLRRTASAFFVYYLFNFSVLLTMSMYFRMVGSVSRSMEQTMAPSSIAILLCSIYAGFVIPVPYMVPWLGWYRHINPLAYVYESMMINEDITKAQDPDTREQTIKEAAEIAMQTVPERSAAIFHWKNLSYSIKAKGGTKRILNNIDGWVKPGTMTALMGVSGAGKTTLLDVLANRATSGTVSGDVFIGNSRRDSSFQRRVGYVQQEDVHPPLATVRETLQLSARLRQSGSETEQEQLAYVDLVLNILDMESYAEAMVGTPGQGINIEQRKRLSIGVELVARPELLLFLDEPTSGLDSQTAWSICTLLRKLADRGQAILCTIHQPSSQIFQMFDRLLLLGPKGQTLYFGDIGLHSTTLIDYFEQNGAPRYQMTLANPAEWMLDVTSRSNDVDGWTTKHNNSEQRREMLRYQAELLEIGDDCPKRVPDKAKQHDREYAVSYAQQLRLVTMQVFREYWRDPTYMYSKYALCTGLSLFNGLSFTNTPLDIQGLTNILFSIFLLSMLFSTMNQQIIPRLIDSRALYESREAPSKSYSWFVFLSANITVELFWQTLAAVLVFITWWLPIGIWKHDDLGIDWVDRSAMAFIAVWLFCLWISTFSQAIAVGIKHTETAVQVATLSFWMCSVFCGVLIQPTDLPRFWIFIYRVSPLTYFINGMVLAGLGNTLIHCSATQLLHLDPPKYDKRQTCSEYLGTYIQFAGGYVENPTAVRDCRYCPVLETDKVLQDRFGMDTNKPWFNGTQEED